VDVTVPEHDQPLVLLSAPPGRVGRGGCRSTGRSCWPGRPAPSLMLRPAAYVIVTLDRSGKELAREDRRVE
jgi:hypothetical protein